MGGQAGIDTLSPGSHFTVTLVKRSHSNVEDPAVEPRRGLDELERLAEDGFSGLDRPTAAGIP